MEMVFYVGNISKGKCYFQLQKVWNTALTKAVAKILIIKKSS